MEAQVSESALKGYRTLAVARGPETGTPTLLGLVSLFDPPDAITRVTDAHDFCLCDGGVPCRQRRSEGRADQMARSYGGGLAFSIADHRCYCGSKGSHVLIRVTNAERWAKVK